MFLCKPMKVLLAIGLLAIAVVADEVPLPQQQQVVPQGQVDPQQQQQVVPQQQDPQQVLAQQQPVAVPDPNQVAAPVQQVVPGQSQVVAGSASSSQLSVSSNQQLVSQGVVNGVQNVVVEKVVKEKCIYDDDCPREKICMLDGCSLPMVSICRGNGPCPERYCFKYPSDLGDTCVTLPQLQYIPDTVPMDSINQWNLMDPERKFLMDHDTDFLYHLAKSKIAPVKKTYTPIIKLSQPRPVVERPIGEVSSEESSAEAGPVIVGRDVITGTVVDTGALSYGRRPKVPKHSKKPATVYFDSAEERAIMCSDSYCPNRDCFWLNGHCQARSGRFYAPSGPGAPLPQHGYKMLESNVGQHFAAHPRDIEKRKKRSLADEEEGDN